MCLENSSVPNQKTVNRINKPVSLLILEGYTEQIFYSIVRDKFLKGIRIKLRNIKGQGNINREILSEVYKYTYNNSDKLVRVYCCMDTHKNKLTATPFELELIREKTIERKMNQVLSIEAILAKPEIESWFFYDIKGIYRFLRVRRTKRNEKKYNNPYKFGKLALQQLFERFNEEYMPGKRATHFISCLDMNRIVSGCKELREGIILIKSRSKDLTNHLVSTRKHIRN